MSVFAGPWEMAVDVGSLRTKLAVAPPAGMPSFRVVAATDGGRADLGVALATARELSGGAVGGLSLAVPDAWMAGTTAGARALERFSNVVAGATGSALRTSFVGRLAAVAAAVGWQRAFRQGGRYLVCDVGGQGVRAGVVAVADQSIRLIAAHETAGGGWCDFDAAVRDMLPVGDEQARGQWHHAVATAWRRAEAVLDRAVRSPSYAGARVAVVAGAQGPCELTAGQLIDCFQATAAKVREAVAAVLASATPELAVLVGGLGDFPLASWVVAEMAGIEPERAAPEAAAHGALLLMRGAVRLIEPEPPSVSLPMHQIRNGLLEELSRELPWRELPAEPDGEPLQMAGPDLVVDVAGRRTAISMTGLSPGSYRIVAYRTWSGRGLLGVLPEHPRPGEPTVFYPLDQLEPADA